MFIDIRGAVALSGRHANTIKRWGRAGKFRWSKPGGSRNAAWSIDRENFIAFLRSEHDQPYEASVLAKPCLLIPTTLPHTLPESTNFALFHFVGHGTLH